MPITLFFCFGSVWCYGMIDHVMTCSRRSRLRRSGSSRSRSSKRIRSSHDLPQCLFLAPAQCRTRYLLITACSLVLEIFNSVSPKPHFFYSLEADGPPSCVFMSLKQAQGLVICFQHHDSSIEPRYSYILTYKIYILA